MLLTLSPGGRSLGKVAGNRRFGVISPLPQPAWTERSHRGDHYRHPPTGQEGDHRRQQLQRHVTSGHTDAYPTVAGVAAAASAFARSRPGLCGLREIGRSREDRPLQLLTVGRGRRQVLVVAGPHSDERVGPATALRLAARVAADAALHSRADAAWHFLLCLDPDGTVRSEAGPAVRRRPAEHFRHAYRPPADEQPEWAPSIRPPGDQLPESRALVGLIDELRPELQCSLHGNDLGGSWIQLTRDLPGLAEPLGKLSAERDVPVQTGTYDAMYWKVSGPGVYVMPEPGERAQFASLPEDVNRSTWIRPHRYGGMTALFEVPMWASRHVADSSPHPDPARALGRAGRAAALPGGPHPRAAGRGAPAGPRPGLGPAPYAAAAGGRAGRDLPGRGRRLGRDAPLAGAAHPGAPHRARHRRPPHLAAGDGHSAAVARRRAGGRRRPGCVPPASCSSPCGRARWKRATTWPGCRWPTRWSSSRRPCWPPSVC